MGERLEVLLGVYFQDVPSSPAVDPPFSALFRLHGFRPKKLLINY